MKTSFLAGFAIFAAGCTANLSTGAPSSADPAVNEVAFSCTNGESLTVRFIAASETAVLVRHGDEIELQQQPSGSGFIYSNGPNTIRGKGDALTVEIGRMVPIHCTAL